MHVPCQSLERGRVPSPDAGEFDPASAAICLKNKARQPPAEKSEEKPACGIRPGGRSPSRRAVNGRSFSITRARRYLFLEKQPARTWSKRPRGSRVCGKASRQLPSTPYRPPDIRRTSPGHAFGKSAWGELTSCRISLVSYLKDPGNRTYVRAFRYNRNPVGELSTKTRDLSSPKRAVCRCGGFSELASRGCVDVAGRRPNHPFAPLRV